MAALAAASLAVLPSTGHAALAFNTGLAGPAGTYFGTGNPNTNWTVETTAGGYELGVQATRPFIGPITPVGNVYTASTGNAPGLAPRWAFSFSYSFIDLNGVVTRADLQALNLTIDDVGHGTSVTFNMLSWPGAAGFELGANVEHGPALPTDHGQQDNTNLGFPGVTEFFAPQARLWEANSYIFTLEAICGGAACGGASVSLGSVSMQVNTVPEPVSIALLGLGVAAVGFARRRRTA